MRQTATAKTLKPDPLIEHLEAARDEALSTVRDLLAPDAPPVSGYPREVQVERALDAAEAAQRRLNLFASGAAL